jgi:transposase InsO family protein
LVEDLKVLRPDQVWVADITYIRLRRDFMYLAVIMDVFTRLIRGRYLGRDLAGELSLTFSASGKVAISRFRFRRLAPERRAGFAATAPAVL